MWYLKPHLKAVPTVPYPLVSVEIVKYQMQVEQAMINWHIPFTNADTQKRPKT